MAINEEMRLTMIGASEVSQILGLSPWGDAFSIYARKMKMIEEPKNKPWLKRGKYFEKGIIDWYSDVTGRATEWSDETIRNSQREYQCCTPDAFVLDRPGIRVGGCDAKTANWQHRDEFGDSGTEAVPVYYAVQNHWTMSTLDKEWWDLAVAFSLDELRIYRIHRNAEVEAVLLDEVERWWKKHIVGRVAPPIGASPAAKEYLEKRYPKDIEPLRVATAEERELMANLRTVGSEWDRINKEYDSVANQVKLAIGDSAGLIDGKHKVAYSRSKDSVGTDWEASARHLARILAIERGQPLPGDPDHRTNESINDERDRLINHMEKNYKKVIKAGSRRLLVSEKR